MSDPSTNRRGWRAVLAVASALIVLPVLAACGPGDAAPAPTQKDSPPPSASPTPSATPRAAALPTLSGDEVLTVYAHAKAPNGAALDLTLTVHYPIAYNTPDGEAVIGYLASIHDQSEITAKPDELSATGASLQIIDIDAKDATPGTVWPTSSGVLLDLGPNNTGAAFGLPLARAGGTQGSYLVTGAGSGHAVTSIPGTDGTVDPSDWVRQATYYGLSSWEEVPATLIGCTIDLTPKGTTPESLAWISNWEPGHLYCTTGTGGE